MARRVKRSALVVAIAWACLSAGAALADPPSPDGLGLVPRPVSERRVPACAVDPRAIAPAFAQLPAGLVGAGELARERWTALGIDVRGKLRAPIAIARDTTLGRQAYTLHVGPAGVRIRAGDDDGAFYALVTLAQLARERARGAGGYELPCADIADAPALRWRILSDDVSRGPLPTMRYFKERIRTIASLKMNGYSPYMEHVFVDPKDPLPSPLDGITPAQLRELATYAARFHVAFVPEQQTFAHMHETLKYERYADLAETPHGYLLSPARDGSATYATDLIADELAAVPHPPFFHIGSDEPSDLGRGLAKDLVTQRGDGPVYSDHVVSTANFVLQHSGARPMIWDDAIARHPELFATLPKQLVFVNWHYGSEPTYKPYIDRIAHAGFDQMVAPGALNWNEIYPDIDTALANIDRFVTEGKAAHVLGLFQTVWHDDGETLFEATWVPVAYAAASAWETGSVDRARFARDFPHAFFGIDDQRYADDFAALGNCRSLLADNPREYTDYLFWEDPLAPDLQAIPADKVASVRLAAERVMQHLRTSPPPPLHANAAAAMFFAADRYDVLGRDLQIAAETQHYYADARTLSAANDSYAFRDLNVTKYFFWEIRDAMFALQRLHRDAWEYENRPSHEESVLERYRIAADLAIERADRISDASIALDKQKKPLPAFDDLLRLP
jgi:hypothetical protein